MKINKNSWHYKLFAFGYEEGKIPTSTNLCHYVRRCLLSIPLVVLVVVLFAISVVCVMAWNVLVVGKRPIEFNCEDKSFVPYPLPKIRGFIIRPVYIIVLIICGYFYYNYLYYYQESPVTRELANFTIEFLSFLGLGLVLSCFIIAILWVLFKKLPKVFETETGILIKEYLKARKQKICPVINFQ